MKGRPIIIKLYQKDIEVLLRSNELLCFRNKKYDIFCRIERRTKKNGSVEVNERRK